MISEEIPNLDLEGNPGNSHDYFKGNMMSSIVHMLIVSWERPAGCEEKIEGYHWQHYYSLPALYMPAYSPAVSWEGARLWESQEAGWGGYKEFRDIVSEFKALCI